MTAAGLVPWAIEALVASTVLMVAVLALRGPVRRAFGPDIAYALWALPALRMLLPPLPQSWREIAVAPVIRASEQITVYVIEPLGGGATAPAAQYPSLGPILVSLWMAGAVAFICWHAAAHASFCRRMLAETARESEIAGGIQLIETTAASGPLAFGLWRRYVAFPRDFDERYDAEERDLALAHELGHHARGDLFANWIALVVLALHWFNPVAWRAFRADQEIANDARVLAGQNPMVRHTYACAIVKAAHGGAVSAACHLHTIDDLKGRLRMLTTNKTSRLRLLSGSAAITLLMLAGLGVTASGTQAAERVRSGVEKATGVNLAVLDPVPPVAAMASVAPVQAIGTVPPAPPAPPAIKEGDEDVRASVSSDDRAGHRKTVRIVRHNRDGELVSENFTMPDVPEVSSSNCPGDETRQMVVDEKSGGKHRIIICTNRIEKAASTGAAIAANGVEIQRNAYRSALEELRNSRARMATNQSLRGEARSEALESMDESIEDLEEQLAEVN